MGIPHLAHLRCVRSPSSLLSLSLLTATESLTLISPSVLELMLERIPSSKRTEVCDVLREIGGKVTFPHVRGKLGLARSASDYLEKWAVSGASARTARTTVSLKSDL